MHKELPETIQKFLEGHARGVEAAKERSIRTGVPLVYERDGKIFEVPPKYKYIKVPIDTPEPPLEEE